MSEFVPGDRVRLSAQGRAMSTYKLNRRGVFVRFLRGSRLPVVRWDDNKTTQVWRPEYLEKDES